MILDPVARGKSIIAEIASFEPQYKSLLGMGMVLVAGGLTNLSATTMTSAVLALMGALACYSLAIYLGIADLREMKARTQAKHPEFWPRFFPVVTITVAVMSVLFLVFQGYVFFWAIPRAINTVPNL